MSRNRKGSGPIRSMTGFGSAEEHGPGFSVSVEVRSVNHRYLKIQSRIPDEMIHMGGPAEAAVREVVRRGSVILTARLELQPSQMEMLVDQASLRKWQGLIEKLSKQTGLAPPTSLVDYLRLPGVLPISGEKLLPRVSEVKPVFERALKGALKSFKSMREREGKALGTEMIRRLKLLLRLLEKAEKKSRRAMKKAKGELVERVSELLGPRKAEISEQDLAREVALLAERTDVTEEIDRLKSHAAQALEALQRGGEIGRQLEFLTQEMLRETTTMAAKAANAEFCNLVLEIKLEVDRLKEQAQNIE